MFQPLSQLPRTESRDDNKNDHNGGSSSSRSSGCISTNDSTNGKLWQVEGYKGTVGFITTMTDAFCGTCNRLRLTADGNLKTCLHGRDELDLKALIRAGASDEELILAIGHAVRGKHAALGGRRLATASTGTGGTSSSVPIGEQLARPMIRIGG